MKKDLPLISIVLLSYNSLEYIRKTIPAILKLNYANYELVIVDNGSEDGTIEYLESFKNIKLVKNDSNLGYSKGKNIGVKFASGKFILLLDDDIEIGNKEILNELYEFYNTKENIGFISIPLFDLGKEYTIRYGCFYSLFGQANLKPLKKSDLEKLPDFYSVPAPTGGIMFFKKVVWNDIGGYDESFKFHMDDYDIGARSVLFGYENYILNSTGILHLGVAKNLDNRKWFEKFKYFPLGFSAIIIKNYQSYFFYLFFFFLLVFAKTVKNCFSRLSFLPLLGFFISYILLFKKFSFLLSKRKKIQSKRVVSGNYFLKIKSPRI